MRFPLAPRLDHLEVELFEFSENFDVHGNSQIWKATNS